jgi:hypothetical protein
VNPTADDGCECKGTACCGTGCQTLHNNGNVSSWGPAFNKTFWDCAGPSSQTAANDACASVLAAGFSPPTSSPGYECMDSGQGVTCMLYVTPNACQGGATPTFEAYACWAYSGAAGAGNLYGNNLGGGCYAITPANLWTALGNGANLATPAGTWN